MKKRPTVPQLLAVLKNKSSLMTKTQESLLWQYYKLAKQDKEPTEKHLIAWFDFLEKEATGEVPVDPLVQLREDVNATYTRVTENDAALTLLITNILDRLDKIESHINSKQE